MIQNLGIPLNNMYNDLQLPHRLHYHQIQIHDIVFFFVFVFEFLMISYLSVGRLLLLLLITVLSGHCVFCTDSANSMILSSQQSQ